MPRTDKQVLEKLAVRVKPELKAALRAECQRERERNGFFVGFAPVVIRALHQYLGLRGSDDFGAAVNGGSKLPSIPRGTRGRRVAA